MGGRRAVAAAVVLAALLLMGPLDGAAAGVVPATTTGWGWPLESGTGAPRVLRGATIPAQRWQPGHRGVDLAAAPGQAVLAPVDGVVVAASRVAGRGVVSIRSASGWRATLEPVDPVVHVGEQVRRGQQVGTLSAAEVGHCGSLSCLHWGVRSGSGASTVYRDPLALLRRRVVLLPVPGWGQTRATAVSWPRRAWRASR